MTKEKSAGTAIRLTVSDINSKALPPDPEAFGDRKEYRFSNCAGLVLRVTKTGKKTFYFHKRIPGSPGSLPHKEKLFDYPEEKSGQKQAVQDAESKTIQLLALIRQTKEDPKETRRKEAQKKITYGELFELYMEQYARQQKKAWAEAEAMYRRYFKEEWHNRQVNSIEPIHVQQWLNRTRSQVAGSKGSEGGTATANRIFELFRAVMRWGQKMRAVEISFDPCIGVETFPKISRERFLQPHEWESFKNALENEPNPIMKDFFWMCLRTGARSGNVMKMRWENINWDLATWTIPAATIFNKPGHSTKNNKGQVVTLGAEALEVLMRRKELSTSEEWVFPARTNKGRPGSQGHMTEPKSAWKKLLERANLYSEDKSQRLCIHDLRRTVGSYMAIQGVDTKAIGQALGHRSPASTLVYARLTQSVVRTALENVQAAFGDVSKLINSNGSKPSVGEL